MSMRAKELLKEKEGEIFKLWQDKVYSLFPEETVRFLKKETERFENPLGYRLEEGLKGLLSQFTEEFSWEKVDYYLERILKIQAVQSLRPSEALSFLYYLKSVVREVVGERILEEYGPEGLLEVEDHIDAVILRAFNQYMAAREKLNELKFQEWKSRLFLLLKRAGYIYDEREGSLSVEAHHNEKTL
ncbi:MAG TPA: hypothetical protein EYP81_04380 [Thermodesulfobacteriaceae bacterium]|nr:hypothetical protein [Thermodesulfobacteriaceae bacterium]